MPERTGPVFSFSDGVLHIVGRVEEYRIRGWPEPRAARREKGYRGWRPVVPAFRLVYPYRPRRRKPGPQLELPLFDAEHPEPRRLTPAQRRRRALDRFRFSLPKEVARAVEPFLSRQWPLIPLFHLSREALEVCAANPTLVFLAANVDSLGPREVADPVLFAARLVLKKQRDVLEYFGFPGTESVARIIRKFAPESVRVENLRILRALLADTTLARQLSHLDALNSGALALLQTPERRAACTAQLIKEVATSKAENYQARVADRLDEILFMHERLTPNRRFPKVRCIEHLNTQHDVLLKVFVRERWTADLISCFPNPPIPGSEVIRPIRTPTELYREGHVQRHCVGTYAERVAKGDLYIYQVLAPERATVAIARGPDGNWRISELRLSCNRAPSPATRAAVEAWIESHSL